MRNTCLLRETTTCLYGSIFHWCSRAKTHSLFIHGFAYLSIYPYIYHIYSIYLSTYLHTTNQPTNQPTNKPTNQQTNQPTKQASNSVCLSNSMYIKVLQVDTRHRYRSLYAPFEAADIKPQTYKRFRMRMLGPNNRNYRNATRFLSPWSIMHFTT